jgi:hypothetical protein
MWKNRTTGRQECGVSPAEGLDAFLVRIPLDAGTGGDGFLWCDMGFVAMGFLYGTVSGILLPITNFPPFFFANSSGWVFGRTPPDAIVTFFSN